MPRIHGVADVKFHEACIQFIEWRPVRRAVSLLIRLNEVECIVAAPGYALRVKAAQARPGGWSTFTSALTIRSGPVLLRR